MFIFLGLGNREGGISGGEAVSDSFVSGALCSFPFIATCTNLMGLALHCKM